MFCINCFHAHTTVTNSRPHKKTPSVWRRRTCEKCHTNFTTVERPSLTENKKIWVENGTSETFNIGKLLLSIAGAFSHDSKKAQYDAIWLAQTVEDILSTQYKTITVDDISVVTHQTLKNFDELAAIQYAAKYGLIVSLKRRGRTSLAERAPRTDELPSR